MTTATPLRVRPVPRPPSRRDPLVPVGVLLAALAVVALRLPFVDAALGRDESGYLTIGAQWHRGGTSLYGNYWVDRPPLLVTIFGAAAHLGGAVPLRLIGIGFAVVAVLAVAHAARTLSGPRTATWAAVAAAALWVSPISGAFEVNGELLAAPFVAVGIAGLVSALTAPTRRRALVAAAAAGACGIAAVLVKQNMVDVLVFGAVLVLTTARRLGTARVRTVGFAFLAGGGLAAAATALWTVAHGTSLSGVWFAMYRFRMEAARTMAAHPSAAAPLREHDVLLSMLATGMAFVVVLLATSVVRRRRDHPSSSRSSTVARAVPVALAATVAYDALSIYLGGSFWSHYLVQLIVPLSLAAGLAVAHRPRSGRAVVGLVVVSAAVSIVVAGPHPAPADGNPLGRAIAAAARPGDTIVTIWGHSDVTHASGLASPYPYLWALPTLTLDPRLRLLDATMRGDHAPTWFVSWSGAGLHGIGTSRLASTLSRDYHPVGHFRGPVVYLRDGVHRAVPLLARRPAALQSARPDADALVVDHSGASAHAA